MCFLPYDLKVQLAAESLTSELLSDIRTMSLATGVLHALLPRSTRWKLSLYTSRQLLVLSVSLHFSTAVTRSPDPVLAFAVNSCAPFLLAFAAAEIPLRALRNRYRFRAFPRGLSVA